TLAYYLGRPIVYSFAESRIGHFFLLSKEKVEHAENYFLKNGKTSTFIGRLVPGIRHLISIPAGLAKMSLKHFMLYTFIGAGIWNIILAVVGYFMYGVRDQVFKYIGPVLLGVGVIFVIYLIIKGRKSKKAENS
ncbi:MAG: DedA family protein, partial [Methanosarcina sp.]